MLSNSIKKMTLESDCERIISTLVKTYFKPENLPDPPNLPVNRHWREIQDSIAKYPVTIVAGSTGCGKTTQVPQLLLEHELYKNRRMCRMVVTQPRRIAAISVAHTVCRDRKWQVGSICGYQVGMDREIGEDSLIQYVTTNVLVEKIIHQKSTEAFTHIIVDEIHERHQDLDCLLFLLKTLPEKTGYRPKIILMSATAESKLYAEYFGAEMCNHVSVEGSVYSVDKWYLEDIPPEICSKIQAFARGRKVREEHQGRGGKNIKAQILHVDVMKAVADLVETFEDRDQGVRGAVLIFVPGYAEITQMIRVLDQRKDRCRFELIPLHSRIPLEEQNRAFKKVPSHVRKIIVATNIAESSITVPDIRYVIDFCFTKNQVVDKETGFQSYQIEFCSQANCDQRAGRAGRVQNGIVYRLVSKKEYQKFSEFPTPEILRCSVDISVLKIKKFGLDKPKEVLREFISPPAPEDVARAIITLKEVQAMQLEHNGQVDVDDGNLTILGRVMATLPVDIRLSKLILMGFAFGCFEECVKIAACLSVDDLLYNDEDPLENYRNKMDWAAGSFSDPLMLMHAFDAYLSEKEKNSSDDFRVLREWARNERLQFRRLVEAYHQYEDLKQRLSLIGFRKPSTPNMKPRDESLQNFFVMMALCGAFYPYYYALNPCDYLSVKHAMGDHNPTNTMIISNFPENHGPLYAQTIRAALSKCLLNDFQLSFQSIDAYLTFENDDNDGTPLDMYLCELYRRKRDGISVPKISESVGQRLLAELNIASGRGGPEIKVMPMSQSIVSNFKKPPLPTEKSLKGVLTWFEDILTFYMTLDERALRHQDLQHEIADELTRNEHKLVRLGKNDVEVGMPVLAEYQRNFYRARVVNDAPKARKRWSRTPSEIAVFFIDYGNTGLVDFVYKMPESMLLCNDEAPFAYKAQLAHLKLPDGKIREPVDHQSLSKNKRCRIDIFSIVHDTLRVTLFVEEEDEEVNVNERLVYEKHAIHDQEPDFSQDKSKLNLTQNLVLRGEEFIDLCHYGLGTFKLNGPRSPLANDWELKPLSKGSADKLMEITSASINNILFGSTSNYQQFVVGHMMKLSPDCKRLQLMQCTLMTKLPMMLPFVALVFSPRAEYRCNESKTKFVGAVCGMGTRRTEDGKSVSVCKNNDLEVPFSQELDRIDAKIINEIRRLLNEAFCGNNEVFEWTSVPILKIQKKIEDYTMRFFNISDRVEIDRDYCRKAMPKWSYQWNLVEAEMCVKDDDSERQILFRPHPIYRIRDAAMCEVLYLLTSFQRSLEDESEVRKTLCPICCVTFDINRDARAHCQTTEHSIRMSKLRGIEYHESDDSSL